MADSLFSLIARIHGQQDWGSVLDAGTGDHSLQWITSLSTTDWTAITGSPSRAQGLSKRFEEVMRPNDAVLCGNWQDPMLLQGTKFDTVICDYLIGAIAGFAPYFQTEFFHRIQPHVGKRIYVVGLEPYPQSADTPGGQHILEIARLRDACILLAGHRCYREYPMNWCIKELERAGFIVDAAEHMGIRYGPRFINGQLDVCMRKLPHFNNRALAEQMSKAIAELRQRALALKETSRGIQFGQDYVIAARTKD